MSTDVVESRSNTRRRVVIMGAAGRDFHNFNVVYRDDPNHEVVARQQDEKKAILFSRGLR